MVFNLFLFINLYFLFYFYFLLLFFIFLSFLTAWSLREQVRVIIRRLSHMH